MNGRSGHGGRRAGAGRKPLVGFEERIWIAATFDRRVSEASKAKAEERRRATDPSIEAIEGIYEELHKQPLEKRQKRARMNLPYGEGDTRIDELVGDLRAWVEGEGSRKGGRLISAPQRIYAQRRTILQAVATEATERFGVPISPRFVEGCVEEYRRIFPRPKPET